MKPIFPALAACLTLAACAVPTPPSIGEREVDRAFAEAARISRLPETGLTGLPTGSATYSGQIGADVTGDLNGSILGDMAMTVGFGADRVTGSVTNINLIDTAGRPDQLLDGGLAISGFEDRGNILAGARGDVSGVTPGGSFFTSDMNLTLQGSVRDDFRGGDAVFGTATGNAVGDVDLFLDGVFFGTR
ncbi:hypothetical protein [Yoonia vestfoldensis]|uniref:hypothetical protein n=1 Tax=Yoonia vestfoldensis TaxID=245188 RepID=UPI00035E1B7C|nr:hypothetical protein [Yoonia vestfoldensis]